MIDLRSDTVTRPTPEMLQAMSQAEVGDDVYGEDPTVRKLEEAAAELVGKESALFVPTGTMGNQAAIMAHTGRGDEVLVDAEAHVVNYEVGAPSMLAGVQLRMLPFLLEGNTPEIFTQSLRPENIHFSPQKLLCLENTFNRGGGTIVPSDKMQETYQLAREKGMAVHLDGARIFNASVAAGQEVKDFTRCCDTIMFCLSKGLGAPVGSLLAGSKTFIERARKYRKALGGGMRQAGVLAAAGLVALDMRERLSEDHQNARKLAEGLNTIEEVEVDLEKVQTNMVILKLREVTVSSYDFCRELKARGVLAGPHGVNGIRLVTHKDVFSSQVEEAREIIGETVERFSRIA